MGFQKESAIILAHLRLGEVEESGAYPHSTQHQQQEQHAVFFQALCSPLHPLSHLVHTR